MALFGLKYPIFEAPHGARNTTPELAIAVSKAGAMGALALTDHTPASAHDAVSKVRAATKGAFFINYILEFPFESGAASLQAALDAGAPIVQFSWGLPPKEAISAIRAAGAKLGMQVTSRERVRGRRWISVPIISSAKARKPVDMCKRPEGCTRRCRKSWKRPSRNP